MAEKNVRYNISVEKRNIAAITTYDLIGETIEVFANGESIGTEKVTEDNRMSFALILIQSQYEFEVHWDVT